MTFRSLSSVLATILLVASSAAQTINSNITNEWLDRRYTDHGDGTVTDIDTGLSWAKCSLGQSGTDCEGHAATMDWKVALEQAEKSTLAGYNDWRLPNLKELASLAALDRYDPAINTTVFPKTPSAFFWSSSPFDGYYVRAWGVHFHSGGGIVRYRRDGYHVRLVRSSQ